MNPLRFACAFIAVVAPLAALAQPTMTDPTLEVVPAVTGLNQPTTMACLGPSDFLVLEKASGQVQHVVNGAIVETSLDLAVNSASERGLLGICLHPDFPVNPSVYLYYTLSSTGADSTDLAQVELTGNRVDRFTWDGHHLTFAANMIKLRSYQADLGQPLRGNHNGGVISFGPDRKLYFMIGDNGRRGYMQNNLQGPNPDDQFGGPFPDDAHTTGCIYRLNDDGSTPIDNPFFISHVSPRVDKLYMYGLRNGFGLTFDPVTGLLWTEENGDDSFDEINQVVPGMNGGWIEACGPLSRVKQFHDLEVASGSLQQLRWPPTRIATDPWTALRRMYMIPGARYKDPEFSWKNAVAPAGIGFIHTDALGADHRDNLFVGEARTTLLNGYLFEFKLSPDRRHFVFSDNRLNDLVADNNAKFDVTESESLVAGQGFGVGTDIKVGTDGKVYVVSLDQGTVFEIRKR
ncbi:MAG: PQQ-dependent sugar dehydrogenase [Armatimonadetes bacterium]|nr:PQQ-dependent sugar dehydrogenase [Armatimonadota bacterium]